MLTSLTRQQKDKIQSFISFAGSNEKVATKTLKAHNWNLEVAVEEYLIEQGSTSLASKADKPKLNALFEKYREPDEDSILVDGMGRFCEDIAVDPADVVTLVMAWHLNAPRMCVFTREQFVEGFANLGCDTLDKIKNQLTVFRSELKDDKKFKEIYQFAFNFGKEPTQKSLALDVAIPLWSLLLKDRFKHLELWCDYVQNNYKKSISRDSWTLLLDFCSNVNDSFSNYDADGAWPVVIDDFVEYARAKLSKQ